jgi:hypothetical protein
LRLNVALRSSLDAQSLPVGDATALQSKQQTG